MRLGGYVGFLDRIDAIECVANVQKVVWTASFAIIVS